MIKLYLQQGDQIQLPTTIQIEGKTHQLRIIDTPKIKRYKVLTNILDDLNLIKNSIQKYISNPTNHIEFFYFLITCYRKCFNSSTGRCVKLEVKRDLKNTSKDLIDLHNKLIQLGNTFVCHADDTLCDESTVFLVLDQCNKRAIGLSKARMIFETFTINEFKNWDQLIDTLIKGISRSLSELQRSIIDEYNQNK